MTFKFIVIPLLVWLAGQTIKLIIYLFQGNLVTRDATAWIYIWAGGSPSSHTAILTASLYLLWFNNGIDALFGFAFVVSLILIYNLLSERKKQMILEHHLKNSNEEFLRTLVIDGKMLDISGHTFLEIFWGAVFGIIMTILLVHIFV